MLVKTSELSGAALDWAVNKANRDIFSPVEFSTKWEFGGPIIEREQIAIYHMPGEVGGAWRAEWHGVSGFPVKAYQAGPNPLIAAMRCYVASKLGDTVDIPEELLK